MNHPRTTTTTNVSKTELPQWVNDAGKANYDTAVGIGNQPLQQYGGDMVADTSPVMRQALELLSGGVGAGNSEADAASGIFSKMANPTAMAGGVSSYMNPWIDNVETKAMGALEDSRQRSLMGNADAAVKSRAFGGSRSAIVDAVTNAESAKEAGILSAGLRKEGFDTAMAGQRQDLSTAGQGMLATSDQKKSNFMKDFASLFQGGQAEQQQAQSEIDANVAKFNEARDKPIRDLNLRMSALGMAPYNTSSTSTGSTTQPSSFDPAQLIMGILSLGLGGFG